MSMSVNTIPTEEEEEEMLSAEDQAALTEVKVNHEIECLWTEAHTLGIRVLTLERDLGQEKEKTKALKEKVVTLTNHMAGIERRMQEDQRRTRLMAAALLEMGFGGDYDTNNK